MTIEELQALVAQQNESIKKLESKNAEIILEKQSETSKRAEAEAEKLKAEEMIAKEKGDFEKLLEIEKTKSKETIESLTTQNTSRFSQLQDQLMTTQVSGLATKLGGSDDNAEMLNPHIAKRLKLEDDNGELKLRVLDTSGAITDKTLDDLEKEFRETTKYANNIQGRKSNGSGAGGDQGGSVNSGDYEKYYKYGTPDYNIDKKMELKASDPKAHEALLKKHPNTL